MLFAVVVTPASSSAARAKSRHLPSAVLLPVAESYGLDPVYFGVVMCVNLCIGLITPPVGTVLYVGCGLSKISMGEIVKPLLPFIAVMFAVLMLITYVPSLITFIPNLVNK